MKKPNLEDMFKFRVNSLSKRRTERVARKRGCTSADVGREALMTFLDTEEVRLGLVKTK